MSGGWGTRGQERSRPGGQFEVSIGLAQIGNWVITRALPVVGAFGSRAGRLLVGTGGEVVQVADDGLAGEVLDLLVECRGLG